MNAEQDDPWHRPPLPLRNFRDIGPLTQADEEWWQSFGRHLKAAQDKFDKQERK